MKMHKNKQKWPDKNEEEYREEIKQTAIDIKNKNWKGKEPNILEDLKASGFSEGMKKI